MNMNNNMIVSLPTRGGDGPSWTAVPTLRATFRTRKLGLRARCTDGHTTKCCTVQPAWIAQ